MKIDGTLTKIYSDYNMAYISEQLAEHETSYPPRQLYFPEVGGKIFSIGALNNTPHIFGRKMESLKVYMPNSLMKHLIEWDLTMNFRTIPLRGC